MYALTPAADALSACSYSAFGALSAKKADYVRALQVATVLNPGAPLLETPLRTRYRHRPPASRSITNSLT
jgi:hypothetical protein